MQFKRKILFSLIYTSIFLGFAILWFNLYRDLAGKQIVAAEVRNDEITEVKQPDTAITTEEASTQKNDFVIAIPSIGVKKEVVRNVDPTNKQEYLKVLENYVAHGKYTLLPNEATQKGNVYLFAHREGIINGKNVGFFRRLDEIKTGDYAYLYFDGVVYTYKYRNSKIVDPSETEIYTAYSATPTLTLQTCENGQSKRLILVFDLVGFDPER